MKGLEETNSEYHDNPALSCTGLKTFLKSPAHYKAAQEERKDTPAFRFGRMVHSLILEPNTFGDNYEVFDLKRTTKEGKAEWARIQDAGIEPIKREELVTCHDMLAAVLRAQALPPGEVERTFRDEIDGVPVQCRPDLIDADGRLYDLKTCQDISAVDRVMYTYGYHIQDAFYRMVIEHIAGRDPGPITFVFVEKNKPHDVAVRQCDPDIYESTCQMIRETLPVYKQCVELDTWPGVEGGDFACKIAKAPAWLLAEQAEGIDLEAFYGPDNEAC